MNGYRIIWEIDLDADDPREAAKKALAYIGNPDSLAHIFDVTDDFTGQMTRIDLDEPLNRDPFRTDAHRVLAKTGAS